MNETQPINGTQSMNEAQFITIPIVEYQQLVESIREISKLRDEIQELRAKVGEHENRLNAHSKKIYKGNDQEDREPDILDELYKEMEAQGKKQVDFATAARMVKRTKGRMLQLKADIALDKRFIIIPSESHSQKLLIRLRRFYKAV